MDELSLYYLPTCYYSQKVLAFLNTSEIAVSLHSTREPENKEYLIQRGGKNQVPCLFIKGEPLYESDDIIAYLKKHVM